MPAGPMTKAILRAAPALLLAAAAWFGWGVLHGLSSSRRTVATIRVRQGDVVLRGFARGELRAARSASILAPNLSGPLQVTKLAPLGSFAHPGDLIVEFDGSQLRSRLEEKQLERQQLDEQLKKAEADAAISANQDEVDLLTARYGVRRAELEAKRNELLPAVDAKKNLLALDEARQRLKELESDALSRRDQSKAEIAVLREKRNQGLIDMESEKRRLGDTKLLAPIGGLVALKPNMPNFFFSGMQVPEIREGDQLSAGVPVADILDPSEMEVLARVDEIGRANLKIGQRAEVRLDALSDAPLRGTVRSIGATAGNAVASGPAKKYDVVLALDMPQLFQVLGVQPEEAERMSGAGDRNRATLAAGARFGEREIATAKLPAPPDEHLEFSVFLRQGLLAGVQFDYGWIPNAIFVPNEAIFEKDGKTVAWVKRGSRFEARPVAVAKRSESIAVISAGLKPGEEAALADPDPEVNGNGKRSGIGALQAASAAKGEN